MRSILWSRILSTTRTSLSGTPQLTRRTSRRYLMLSILPFLSLLKWRLNRSKLLQFHSQRSSPIKRRMVTLLLTRLCFEAMFGIGLTPFGPSMIAPASLKLWLLRNLREHRSAGHVESWKLLRKTISVQAWRLGSAVRKPGGYLITDARHASV